MTEAEGTGAASAFAALCSLLAACGGLVSVKLENYGLLFQI